MGKFFQVFEKCPRRQNFTLLYRIAAILAIICHRLTKVVKSGLNTFFRQACVKEYAMKTCVLNQCINRVQHP